MFNTGPVISRPIAALYIVGIFFFSAGAFADEASELGDKLLSAMGGADAWKDTKTVHSLAVNHHPQARLPYIQEYWYFTDRIEHVVTINNHDMDRKRAYTKDGGYSYLRGESRPFDEERMANEIQSWHRSVYRKLLLLARKDPALQLTIADDGRLEFMDGDRFIGWLMVAEDGTPIQHGGSEDRASHTNFGALMEFGDINWPANGHDESGWRFELLSISALKEEPDIDKNPPE